MRRLAPPSALAHPGPVAFERAGAGRGMTLSRMIPCPSRGWRTARRPPASKAGGAHRASSAVPNRVISLHSRGAPRGTVHQGGVGPKVRNFRLSKVRNFRLTLTRSQPSETIGNFQQPIFSP